MNARAKNWLPLAPQPTSESTPGTEGLPPEDTSEIHDPLDGLVDRAATNPGAPFEPDVIEALAALKYDDPAGFEVRRTQLRDAGHRVGEIDQLIKRLTSVGGGDNAGRDPSQADRLVGLVASAELFHTPDKKGFADLIVNGHRETWPIKSRGFRMWLAHRYFEETDGAANSEATKSALNVIEAKAHFDAPERLVYLRVGEADGKLYLDLCNDTWQAVEIDSRGWRIIDSPPVRFRRTAGMLALPVPVPGGKIEDLRQFLNVKSDRDFVLAVAFLVAALRPQGPYPVVALAGEQGSAKSTFARVLKRLIDPNTAALRSLPREIRDLFIAAQNGHVLSFDNVSTLQDWMSDALCRLATGGSFATRELFTDEDEKLFEAVRPIILNGIEDIITKPDLADRSLFLTLESIPKDLRKSEKDLWISFDAVCPGIIGALLGAVVVGLRMLGQTKLKGLPRMADFALWAVACETAFWLSGTFEAAYGGNREQTIAGVLDNDVVAVAVRGLMANGANWNGTATELMADLNNEIAETQRKSREWPGSPRALSGRLRRAATFLREVGIEIEFKQSGTRQINIWQIPDKSGIPPSVPCAQSELFSGPAATIPDDDRERNDMDDVDDVDARVHSESGAATLNPDPEESEIERFRI